MSDVTVRFSEAGHVTIEGLDGVSYSHVGITDEYTTFQIKSTVLKVGWNDLELLMDGKSVYRESWS